MRPDAYAELAAAMSDVPHLDGASCRNEARAFDADNSAEQIQFSLECCLNFCVCLPACRQWLDSLPDDRKPVGVVAGVLLEHKR